MRELGPERRRRLIFRALPAVGVLAVLALVAGVMVGSGAPSTSERTAEEFTRAWQRFDLRAMYALLDERSRASYSLPAFRRAYARSAATATIVRVAAGEPEGERDGSVEVPVALHTRVFGPIRARLLVPVRDERVAWDPSLTFPGLPAGARLSRRSVPPVRAPLLARDGEVLAEGPAEARSSPLGGLAASVAGILAPATRAADRAGLYARGFPRDWPVGQNGLERAFEGRLAGIPGGDADGRRPRGPDSRASQGDRGPDHDRHGPAGGCRGRARGTPRRHRRAGRANRRDPRPRRHRLLGPPAPRIHVQDRHGHRGARGAGRPAADDVPGADRRD